MKKKKEDEEEQTHKNSWKLQTKQNIKKNIEIKYKIPQYQPWQLSLRSAFCNLALQFMTMYDVLFSAGQFSAL